MNENNTKVDMGEVSDGYHTFNELYEYRLLYNAALFNELAKQGLYDVHKSRLAYQCDIHQEITNAAKWCNLQWTRLVCDVIWINKKI